MTMYYDPFIPCHHSGDHEAMIKLGPAQFILPYMPDDARVLFDAGIEQLGWRHTREIALGGSQFNVFDSAYAMFLAKEFGDRALYAKVKSFVEANNQPTWNHDTGEFWWAYGLDEALPRGQLNAAAAMAEANSLGGWAGRVGQAGRMDQKASGGRPCTIGTDPYRTMRSDSSVVRAVRRQCREGS